MMVNTMSFQLYNCMNFTVEYHAACNSSSQRKIQTCMACCASKTPNGLAKTRAILGFYSYRHKW